MEASAFSTPRQAKSRARVLFKCPEFDRFFHLEGSANFGELSIFFVSSVIYYWVVQSPLERKTLDCFGRSLLW